MAREEQEIQIRNASAEDAPFIAWAVLTAVGYDSTDEEYDKLMPAVIGICRKEDTIYSWRRTRVACIGDRVVGCLVSYTGEDYKMLRPYTWSMFTYEGREPLPQEVIEASGVETKPGEYYLDSLAISPEFRGRNIGRMLLEDGVAIAKSLGIPRVTLIVESDRERLQQYYASVGFHKEDHLMFFGDDYIRMAIDFQSC